MMTAKSGEECFFSKTQKDSAHRILPGLFYEVQTSNAVCWIIPVCPPDPLSTLLHSALCPGNLVSTIQLPWAPLVSSLQLGLANGSYK